MTDLYLFVDEDGTENMSNQKPYRHPTEHFWITSYPSSTRQLDSSITELPPGFLEAVFKVKLSWQDEPVHYTFDKYPQT